MIEQLLSRERTATYKCQEFVNEAWTLITGENLEQRMFDHMAGKTSFELLPEPISPCIVFLSNDKRSPTHIGLFYCGKVLHLAESGQYVPLEVIFGYKNCEFYR